MTLSLLIKTPLNQLLKTSVTILIALNKGDGRLSLSIKILLTSCILVWTQDGGI